MMHLQEAYARCEQVIRDHSDTFYRAFGLLPEPERNGVWAVYTFCRMVDDLVDEHEDNLERLERFVRQWEAFKEGKHEVHFMWTALKDTVERFSLDLDPFELMLEGQLWDVTGRRYDTMEELSDYCHRVAGSVGLMLNPLLGTRDNQAEQAALYLGEAMQLTNILRDVGEDLDRDRCYLPAKNLHQIGLDQSMVLQLWRHRGNSMSEILQPVLLQLAQRAESLYSQAEHLLHIYPIPGRPAVEGALLLYRGILRELHRLQFPVSIRPIILSPAMKQRLLAAACNRGV